MMSKNDSQPTEKEPNVNPSVVRVTSRWQLLLIFLRLGLTSFGGPVAHLGYFRHEFVERRRWLSDQAYADLVALCQFLPGPASSQVGIGIGLSRGGLAGGIAAWSGFTLPSAVALMFFAYGISWLGPAAVSGGWLAGLKVAAVAVVAHALLGMAHNLCPDRPRRLMAVMAALLAGLLPGVGGQLTAMGCAAVGGWALCRRAGPDLEPARLFPGRRRSAVIALTGLVLLLFIPLLLFGSGDSGGFVQRFDSFFRTGALVFGGGHVVLPLLQAEVVDRGWLSKDLFLAGYGAAQAVPGPLFSFAAYLGSAMSSGSARWLNGLVCLAAIYLPSFLLLIGVLPYWERLRRQRGVGRLLLGVNAGVVGLLAAAFVSPVLTSGIQGGLHLLLAAVAFWLLQGRKWPSWSVVLICGLAGGVLL